MILILEGVKDGMLCVGNLVFPWQLLKELSCQKKGFSRYKRALFRPSAEDCYSLIIESHAIYTKSTTFRDGKVIYGRLFEYIIPPLTRAEEYMGKWGYGTFFSIREFRKRKVISEGHKPLVSGNMG
jgi:hypothetical protein